MGTKHGGKKQAKIQKPGGGKTIARRGRDSSVGNQHVTETDSWVGLLNPGEKEGTHVSGKQGKQGREQGSENKQGVGPLRKRKRQKPLYIHKKGGELERTVVRKKKTAWAHSKTC